VIRGLRFTTKGGPGSGNVGHAGRPGSVGGSAPGGGTISFSSQEKVGALTRYQEHAYASINGHLRGTDKPNNIKQVKEDIAKLDVLIDEQPTKGVYVFRGDGAQISSELFEKTGISSELEGVRLTIHDEYFDTKPPSGNNWDEYFTSKLAGVEISDKGFLSTSSSKQIVKDRFVGDGDITQYGVVGMVQITGKSKFYKVNNITGIDTEQEVLFPRGTKLKIKSVRVVLTSREGYIGKRAESFYLLYDTEIVQ